jgi:hypothetical protein
MKSSESSLTNKRFWVQTTTSLDEARNRTMALMRMSPGDYFIFDAVEERFVVPSDPDQGRLVLR